MDVSILLGVVIFLVLEGFIPFLAPKLWMKIVFLMSQKDESFIRIYGASALGLAAVLMLFV